MSAGSDDEICPASPPRTPAPSPEVQLLEVTVLSAQDLHRGRLEQRRGVRAYAVAWADDTAGELHTDVDLAGGADPTWNDRFLFRVDAGFLRSETAAVTVEVRAARRLSFSDAVLGRTRIVVSTFVRPSPGPGPKSPSSSSSGQVPTTRQVAALQLRRPQSLRPQGIVNVAVALLDAAQARSVAPIYNSPGSPDAFSVKDLVMMRPASLCRIAEEEEPPAAPRLVEHSGPLDPRGAAVEQKKLKMTLEKWRSDLSPDQDSQGGGKRGRRRRASFCFSSSVEWDR